MAEAMTFEKFETLAAAHGGALARWPRAERAAAERLLAQSDAARAALAEAAALDAVLDAAAPAPAMSARLTARILADAAECAAPRPAAQTRRQGGWRAWLGRLSTAALIPAPACAAALFGLWLGYAAPEAIAEAAELALGGEYSRDVAEMIDEDVLEVPL